MHLPLTGRKIPASATRTVAWLAKEGGQKRRGCHRTRTRTRNNALASMLTAAAWGSCHAYSTKPARRPDMVAIALDTASACANNCWSLLRPAEANTWTLCRMCRSAPAARRSCSVERTQAAAAASTSTAHRPPGRSRVGVPPAALRRPQTARSATEHQEGGRRMWALTERTRAPPGRSHAAWNRSSRCRRRA